MRRLKANLGLFLALIVPLALNACTTALMPGEETLNLTILHTNNVEGEIDPCACVSDPAGGAARRSGAVTELRAEFSDLYLVDAGDALFGTPESEASLGLVVVETMNAMGYDAATLGDEEFMYGLEALQAAIDLAEYPYLSANIVRRDTGQPFVQESIVLERGGNRVAFLGLTTEDVAEILEADPVMSRELQVLDPIQTAREKVPELVEQADAVIVLSHLGSTLDRELVESVPGITAVIGAHSREMILVDPESNTVPIVQFGYQGDQLGVLKLAVGSKGQTVSAQSESIRLNRDVEADKRIQELLMPYKARAVVDGLIDFSLGLSPLLPLEVHRADSDTQRAYLGALAYPDLFKAEVFPGNDNDAESLLACFIQNNDGDGSQIEFSLLATVEAECVRQGNVVLDHLPKAIIPTRVVTQ